MAHEQTGEYSEPLSAQSLIYLRSGGNVYSGFGWARLAELVLALRPN